jgi:dTDP-glucose 4,6-dehydratase
LANEIIQLTGSKSRVVFKVLPEDDPKVRQPDTKLATEILGWKPKVNRSEGLKRTVEYFKKVIGDLK